MIIKELEFIPDQFEDLINLSMKEGFYFVERLKTAWLSGSNCFSKPGEKLLGAFINNQIIAICGINIDPYTEEHKTGRIRHLYVHPDHRRKGIAKVLLKNIIADGNIHFKKLRLRTHNLEASKFYEKLGLLKIENDEFVTHIWSY